MSCFMGSVPAVCISEVKGRLPSLHWQTTCPTGDISTEGESAEFTNVREMSSGKNAKKKGALSVKPTLPQGRKSQLGAVDL